MRYLIILLSLLLLPLSAARAEVHIGIGISVPGVRIGINIPSYPRLVRVPGYPVYYAPRAHANYFFYDGVYWVFYGDDWYVSSWYNGPWDRVERNYVPLFLLRIPVRYYRNPPQYFHGWKNDSPPHWGDRWGHDWEQRQRGWDKWDRRSTPKPAPLPKYQRQYSGKRYPHEIKQQREINSQHYRYQPRERITREYYQQQKGQSQQHKGQGQKDRRDDRGQDRR